MDISRDHMIESGAFRGTEEFLWEGVVEGPTKSTESSTFSKIIGAPSPDDYNRRVKLGVRRELFIIAEQYQLKTQVGQFLGIVEHGLINARHAFRGLKRDLSYDGDMDADQKVVVYTWRPPWDFAWVGDPFSVHIEQKYPPAERVFAVLVRQVPQPNQYDIYGSVEHWNWIREEDPNLGGAPVDWATRYGEKLWSREI